MNQKVLRTLEFDKIKIMLEAQAVSQIGKELAEALEPVGKIGQVKNMLQCTQEAAIILQSDGRSPVDAFPDMRTQLKRIHAALYLSPKELLQIAICFRCSRLCKNALCGNDGEKTGFLANLAQNLLPRRSVEEETDRCIENEETVADAASAQLARIRKNKRLTNEKVRERLNGMIRSASYQKYLQEPIITIRNGRFVIPVKQEYRQQVPGLIHDQSGSGATLFIEPNAVVELGNEYKKLLSEEAEEVERVLSELTAMIEPYAEDLYEDLQILGDIDLVFAKAKLSLQWRGICPKISENKRIRIVQARHPLIDAASVVPIDLWLGSDQHMLIVTGPNTGGKTVTLKTVGLFSLLTQSGIFLPAADGSEMPVFTEIFADIGDEQSIEQSLSTFSSHMTNIVEIFRGLDSGSLVLLDELGAGTDPVEGAALAMSILDALLKEDCLCVATTHYSEVKAFALTREGAQNASMEFDVDRLCPTYKLIIGIPGKSNAFEISKRLGLSESIIENAREYLKGEDVKFEDIISGAQEQHKIAEEERAMAQEARAELERLRSDMEKEKKKFADERDKMQKKAKDDARRIVADTKAEMDALVSQIHALKGIDRSAADRVIQRSRDALRTKQESLAEKMINEKIDAGEAPKKVQPGNTVRIVSLDKVATVLGAADAKGEVPVQVGIIKMNAKLSDLRLIKDVKNGQSASKVELSKKTVSMELDVRGMQVDDATIIVDRYLDDAIMAGLNEVSIIHGKGTGALRAGLQDHFRHHTRVKSFRIGNYGEGDAGVTVITLKK